MISWELDPSAWRNGQLSCFSSNGLGLESRLKKLMCLLTAFKAYQCRSNPSGINKCQARPREKAEPLETN